jgi:SAM-dependent methyltransferase
MMSAPASCRVCGHGDLRDVAGFADLPRITSDCRPYAAGGQLTVCGRCGAVQKRVTPRWLAEIGEIYAEYFAYRLADGDEQVVFDKASGRLRRRSDVLVERLEGFGLFPETGSMIDIGCGTGVTLASFGRAFPQWALNGFEMGDGALAMLRAIPNFQRLYLPPIEEIDQRFDVVTMIHSLEHFTDPGVLLSDIRRRIAGAHLFVEVCNVEENPFDILVADHLMHFSPATLRRLVAQAGFTPVTLATDWVVKELSLLASAEGPAGDPAPSDGDAPAAVLDRINAHVGWLRALRDAAEQAARADRPFGLFGTSIAATWLFPQLAGRISFMVDEDASRIGRHFMGVPVLSPAEVPAGAAVFVALVPAIAETIARRLSRDHPATFLCPSPFPPERGGTPC